MPSLRRSAAAVFVLLALAGAGAHAQFAFAPAPLPPLPAASAAEDERAYRDDGARHLYAAYPTRIFRGRLPPLLYGVAVVETDVDAHGQILDVRLRRPPTAAEVGPWIVQMIRRAGPFPAPMHIAAEKVTYVETWLVHRSGAFQLDTLTEGQD